MGKRVNRAVLIYRDQLLPYSETFILAQGESCRAHSCLYVGLTTVGDFSATYRHSCLLDDRQVNDRRVSDHPLDDHPRVGDPQLSAQERDQWPEDKWPEDKWPNDRWSAVLQQKSVVLASLGRLAPLSASLRRLMYRLWGWVSPSWVRSLRAFSPKLIHAHFGPDGGYAASLAKALQVPLVVTFHGYDATCHPANVTSERPTLFNFICRPGLFFKALALQRRSRSFTAASQIIAVSQFIRRALIERGCPAEKIVVHYTGIDVQLFQPDPAVKRERVVLFVGRLVEKKGCNVLIEAMAQISSAQKESTQADSGESQLVIIGEGPERSLLSAQAEAAGLRPVFLGKQSPEQVRSWMNRAWLLCAPSITASCGDAEGLCMVTLEAQAMALPVVATYSGGIPEAVIHQQTGLLVNENDSCALAEAILTVLNDRVLRDRLAKAGRSHVKKRFDLHKNTAQLEALYNRVIKGFST